MYTKFYGLSARPFALTPDPAFLYQSRQHQMALNILEYGIQAQAPILLLTGDIGSGKTTILRKVIRDLGDSAVVGLISQTHTRAKSLLPWVAIALDIAERGESDIDLYEAIAAKAIREYARGKRTIVIVDEAQNLGEEGIEELRLLSNINSEQDLVLQILLVGQPELRDVLSRPQMRQTAQRVAAEFHLRPLKPAETVAYISHRLSVVGGNSTLFSLEAMLRVHVATNGVPRLINQLCDYALVYAYADEREKVDGSLILQILRDRRSFGSLPVFFGEGTTGKPRSNDEAPGS